MLKVHKQYEQDVEDGIIMVDLSNVESRHEEDTVTIEEWAKMTEQEKYEHDISESMPEIAEKLEYRKYEDVKYRYLEIGLSKELQRFCQDICNDYGLEYALLLAIMETESTFREDIGNEHILGGEEGGERYYGYMQLSMANCIKAKDYALDAHTPEGNIEMGVVILADLMDAYDNDILMVTMAYKGGEGAAKSWQESGYVLPIAYTVLENYEKYKEMLK
jgi:soluble lytic murein transglycosylase-like protein